MWICHDDVNWIESKLNASMDNLLKWADKWRQRINIEKTETMAFSRERDVILNVYAKGRLLNQVKEKRILGVILDSRLDFTAHIEQSAARGLGQVTRLGALTSGINGASGELMLTLYKTCIRPTLEYGYPVWCSTKDLAPLERVEYQAIRKAVGAMHGSPSSALHVITNILPLDLRLDEILLNCYLKIVRKEDNNQLKGKIAALLSDTTFMDHKILTPLHKLSMILRTISSRTNLDNVEKQLYSSISSCLATKATAVAYTPGSFGSSNSRCEAQARAALRAAQDYLAKTGNDVVAFTDGSALGNPGPCGAGTAIFWKGINCSPSLHKKPVSKLSSSYHGELQAIDLALQVAQNKFPPIKNTRIHICHIVTDCQSALQASVKCNITGNFGTILNNIEQAVTNLQKRNVHTLIYWTAGHIDLAGNEMADNLAKEAAIKARDSPITNASISISEIKNCFKKEGQKRWQKRWDYGRDGQGRIYIGASGSMAPGPEVPGGPFESKKKKSGKCILSNLRGPVAETEPMSIGAMLWDPNLRVHNIRGPTTSRHPPL